MNSLEVVTIFDRVEIMFVNRLRGVAGNTSMQSLSANFHDCILVIFRYWD